MVAVPLVKHSHTQYKASRTPRMESPENRPRVPPMLDTMSMADTVAVWEKIIG